MSNRNIGLIGQFWINLKKSLVIFRTKDIYIGSDELGNKYYERLKNEAKDIKRVRKIVPLNPDPFEVPNVPVEWMTWLQGRRTEPPTTEEIKKNKFDMDTRIQKSKESNTDTKSTTLKNSSRTQFPRYNEYETEPGRKVDS